MTSETLPMTPPAAVAEFSLRLVYPFAFAPGPEQRRLIDALSGLRLPEALGALPLPEPLRAKLARKAGEGREMALWQVDQRRLSPDLYPHLRRLLGAEAESPPPAFRLTDAAWQALTGDYGDFGPGLEMALSAEAARRLGMAAGDPRWLPFSARKGLTALNPPRLHLFGSGIGVLELELAPAGEFLTRHGATAALEFIHAIARLDRNAPDIRWRGTEAATGLEALFAALLGLPDEVPGIEPLASGRLFSFACLRTEGVLPPEEARDLAHRLAHRYTEHYLPTLAARSQGVHAPFENIVHAMGTEGGAAVIGTPQPDGKPVEHAQRFIASVVKDAYWPMALLAHAEFIKLVRLTGDVCREVDFRRPEADQPALEAFRTDILNFRLNYRFSQASQIAHHNRYFDAWREAFGSERLLAELTADVAEVDDYLSYKLEVKRLAQAAWRDRYYAYFGIVVSAMLFVVGLLGANFKVFNDIPILSGPVAWAALFGLGLALLALGIRSLVERASKRRGEL